MQFYRCVDSIKDRENVSVDTSRRILRRRNSLTHRNELITRGRLLKKNGASRWISGMPSTAARRSHFMHTRRAEKFENVTRMMLRSRDRRNVGIAVQKAVTDGGDGRRIECPLP